MDHADAPTLEYLEGFKDGHRAGYTMGAEVGFRAAARPVTFPSPPRKHSVVAPWAFLLAFLVGYYVLGPLAGKMLGLDDELLSTSVDGGVGE